MPFSYFYCAQGFLEGFAIKYCIVVLWGFWGLLLCPFATYADAYKSKSFDAFYPEGPLWVSETLYFAEMSMDRIRILKGNAVETFWREPECGPTSIAPYAKNKFLVLCHLAAKLVVLDENGRKVKDILTNSSKTLFQNPNDSHTDGKGGVFFTDAGLFEKGAPSTGVVYHLNAEGDITKIIDNLSYANGIAFDSDKKKLYISEHLARKVWIYPLDNEFKAQKRKLLFDMRSVWTASDIKYAEAGPDGIEVMSNGSVMVAIYGMSSIVIIKRDALSKHEVGTKFVTNIAASNTQIAVVGAYQNILSPFPGKLYILPRHLLPKSVIK